MATMALAADLWSSRRYAGRFSDTDIGAALMRNAFGKSSGIQEAHRERV
jgi:hypothetical protein